MEGASGEPPAQRVLALRAICLSTAATMFAANLTLGLYVSFGPKPLTPNSTVGLENVPFGGTEQPLVIPTSYITLVPLLATMFFIMGRCGSDPAGGGESGRATAREGYCQGGLSRG